MQNVVIGGAGCFTGQALTLHVGTQPATAPTSYEAARLAYKKAESTYRRLAVRRNKLFDQLNPMRADGFPVYTAAENPNRVRLNAAHTAALQAGNVAWAALAVLQAEEVKLTTPARAGQYGWRDGSTLLAA